MADAMPPFAGGTVGFDSIGGEPGRHCCLVEFMSALRGAVTRSAVFPRRSRTSMPPPGLPPPFVAGAPAEGSSRRDWHVDPCSCLDVHVDEPPGDLSASRVVLPGFLRPRPLCSARAMGNSAWWDLVSLAPRKYHAAGSSVADRWARSIYCSSSQGSCEGPLHARTRPAKGEPTPRGSPWKDRTSRGGCWEVRAPAKALWEP